MKNLIINIDSLLLIGFLIITIFLGWWSSQGIHNFRGFSVGDKTFSTPTIVATTVATVLSGSGFFNNLSQTYDHGLYYLWSVLGGVVISFLLIAYYFGPRMSEFLDKISIAEAMGAIFGKEIRLITAVISFFSMSGLIATQLNVAGQVMHYGLGISPLIGTIIIGLIITIYSVHGGIKSVTFTDVIQFITFGTIIPTIVYFITKSNLDLHLLYNTILINPSFDSSEVFDFTKVKSLSYLSLFIMMCIPSFTPQIFQRNVICKTTKQIKDVNVISSFICISILLLSCFISLLVFSSNPNLKGNEVLPYILTNYSHTGLRGLTLVGVMAMVMSTADSYINSISVLCVNDLWKPFKISKKIKDLHAVRFVSLIIGMISIVMSCVFTNLMELLKLAFTFYAPIITVPFLIALIGFRPNKNCVITAMIGGALVTLIWEYIVKIPSIYSVIPGMISNLLLLFLTHRLFNLPGGWTKINDQVKQEKQLRSIRLKSFFEHIKNFNIKKFLLENSIPNPNYSFVLGFVLIIGGNLLNILFIPNDIYTLYSRILSFLEVSLSFVGTLVIMIPLFYDNKVMNEKYNILIALIWNFALFYLLFSSFLLMKITNFASFQVISCASFILIIALTTCWGLFMLITTSSIFLTLRIFESTSNIIEIKILYFSTLISIIILFFLKPTEEENLLTKEKIKYKDNLLNYKDQELNAAINIKNEFIANFQHTYNKSMTGVLSLSESLFHAWDKLSEDDKKYTVSKIYQSAGVLNYFEQNILTLHKLDKKMHNLNIELFNLSELVVKRIIYCQKLHNDTRNFVFDIEDNINIYGDIYYLTLAIDNLINNAIEYCKEGNIKLQLQTITNLNTVRFCIMDNGIGIPVKELTSIFGMFTTSSLTKSKGGNSGVGLSACEKILKAHEGKIWPELNPIEGFKTSFNFILPLNQ